MEYLTPFLLLLALFLAIINVKLSKWLFGEKRKKISETDGEIVHRWVVVMLTLIIGVSAFIFFTVIDTVNSSAVMGFLLFSVIASCGLQSFMEWKYLRESKQYVIPLILMVVGVVCVFGVFFIRDQMAYTTFQEVVSDQLNEDTTVRSISIYRNDLSENVPMKEARTIIEDQEIITQILEDLSGIELKKVDGDLAYQKYTVRIVATNQVEKDHYATESFYIRLDGNDVNLSSADYEIVGETDHLKTIESLVESEKIDWEFTEEGTMGLGD